MERTTARTDAKTQGFHICPVCEGRFNFKQLVPELHPKNAPPRRFQRLAMCCPHCKTVLRSRYEWRHAMSVLFGLWSALIVVRIATGLPDGQTKDTIMLGLLGCGVVYAVVGVLLRRRDPKAFVRDLRLDPPVEETIRPAR